MRFRSLIAVAMIVPCLLTGCASSPEEPEQTITTATAATTEEPETVATIATEPTTLPPATPPEKVLPEIEMLVADTPNARVYIDDGTLCVETCDEITTGTGSIAYDQIDGGMEAWQSVVAKNVALCALIRTTMDDGGAYASPAKVTVLDHRFESRPILTIVDGEVVEDTVAIELAKNPSMLPNAPYGSDGKNTITSGSQGRLVWISANGNKYHSNSSCSNMIEPWQVSRQEAISQGRDACKKCYG